MNKERAKILAAMQVMKDQTQTLAIQTMDSIMCGNNLLASPEARKVLRPLLRGWLSDLKEADKQARIVTEGQAALVPALRNLITESANALAVEVDRAAALNAKLEFFEAKEAARKESHKARKARVKAG